MNKKSISSVIEMAFSLLLIASFTSYFSYVDFTQNSLEKDRIAYSTFTNNIIEDASVRNILFTEDISTNSTDANWTIVEDFFNNEFSSYSIILSNFSHSDEIFLCSSSKEVFIEKVLLLSNQSNYDSRILEVRICK